MPVDLGAFSRLHPEGQTLIRLWFRRGWEKRQCPDVESFEPFIFTYIAFNGWAACVTGQDQDRRMIDALKAHEGLLREFHSWLGDSSELKDSAVRFQSLWPIFSAKGLRARRIPVFRSTERSAVISHYCAHGATDFKPEAPEPLLNLANTLDALYQVRCNLFHGEKCISSEGDQQVVGAAFRTLVHWFKRCLDA